MSSSAGNPGSYRQVRNEQLWPTSFRKLRTTNDHLSSAVLDLKGQLLTLSGCHQLQLARTIDIADLFFLLRLDTRLEQQATIKLPAFC